jgi:hypothetical protein
MVGNARTKGMMMRQDLLLEAWHHIAHCAGVATAVEPAMERLRAGTGSASLERGDMLVVLPDEGLAVTDVSVVHPAANSFFQHAAHAAASLRDASKFRKYGGGGQVAPSLHPPWSRTGAWAGQRCSFCKPWQPLLPSLRQPGRTLPPPLLWLELFVSSV